MKFSLKEINIEWLKNNLSLIVLIPAILGGLWQLLELASIGIPYIRFFSVSQIVSDGLMILFMSAIIALILKLMMLGDKEEKVASKIVNTHSEEQTINRKLDKSWLKSVAILFIMVIIIMYSFLYPIVHTVVTKHKANFFELIGIVIVGFMCYKILSTAIETLFEITGWKIKSNNPLVKMAISFTIIICGMLGLLGIVVGMRIFHNSFLFPDDLKNVNNIKSKVSDTRSIDSIYFEVVYFNDKYIFIRLTDSTRKNYIKVASFNKLVDE